MLLLHVLQEISKAMQRLINLKEVIKEKRRKMNQLSGFRNDGKQIIQLM
jgi:hypothetical protein